MGNVYKRGKKRWWGKWRNLDGKIKRKSLANTKRDAEKILREIERNIDFQKYGIPVPKPTSIDKLWNNFSETKKDTIRPRTWEVWKPRLKFWKEKHLERGKEFKPFSFSEIEKIRNEALKSRFSNKTVNDYISVIKQVYKYAEKMNALQYNPINDIERLKEKIEKQLRALTEEEFEKIIEHSNDWYKDLFVFLVYTGLRRDEARFLKWTDIKLNEKLIVLGMREDFTTKSGKLRSIPIHKEVENILRKRKNESGLVWESPKGGIFGKNVWRRVLLQTAKRAGIKNITLHTLRHTFGTWLANQKANPYYVMYLMGHRNIETTMKYFHPDVKYAFETINKLPKRKKTDKLSD